MITTALRQDFSDIEAQMPELDTGFRGLDRSGAISQLNTEITKENNKTVQTGHLELQVKYYCNGQLQKTTVTVLETYHKNIKSRETIRKMLQAKASLESQGIKGELVLRSKRGQPLVTVKAQEVLQDAKKTEILNPKIVPQKLAELLADSEAKAVIIRSKPQLNEIKKFAERLGIEKIIVPQKMLQQTEYDPKVQAMPNAQKIVIAEITQKQQQHAVAVELHNQNRQDIFEGLRLPKLQIQSQIVASDDLAFRQGVVDQIIGLFAADEEHAKKQSLPVRDGIIQGKNAALAIKQLLVQEAESAPVLKLHVPQENHTARETTKQNLALLYAKGIAQRSNAA